MDSYEDELKKKGLNKKKRAEEPQKKATGILEKVLGMVKGRSAETDPIQVVNLGIKDAKVVPKMGDKGGKRDEEEEDDVLTKIFRYHFMKSGVNSE